MIEEGEERGGTGGGLFSFFFLVYIRLFRVSYWKEEKEEAMNQEK